MSILDFFYVILPFASFITSSILALLLLFRFKVIGSRAFAYVLILSAIWALFNGLEHLDLNSSGFFWARLSRIPISLIPVLWFLFAMNYAHQKYLIPDFIIALLLVIPFLTNLFLWIPATQHMVWTDHTLKVLEGLSFFTMDKGAWYWIYSGYLYGLLFLGALVVLLRLTTFESIFKKQAYGILAGFISPFIANIAFQSQIFPILVDDLTPTLLGLGGIIIYTNIHKSKLFDILPSSHSAIFTHSIDGILILDNQYRILSANRSAELFLNEKQKIKIGSALEDLMPQWPEYLSEIQTTAEHEHGYVFLKGERILEIRLVMFNNQKTCTEQNFLFIRDETLRMRAQHEMEINQNKYHALYENMLNGAIIFKTSDGGLSFDITSINQFAQKNLGIPQSDFLLENAEETLASKEYQSIRENLSLVWQRGQSMRLPAIKIRENGEFVWREFSLYKFSDSEVILIYQDTSEEMRAKEKLTLSNIELELYVQQLESFSTTMLYLNQYGQKLQSCSTMEEVVYTVHKYAEKLFPNHPLKLAFYDLFHQSYVHADQQIPSELMDDFDIIQKIKTLPINQILALEPQPSTSSELKYTPLLMENQETPNLYFISRYGNEKMAVISIGNSAPDLDVKNRQLVFSVIERMVLALSTIDLQQLLTYQALHDEITGFYNRYYLVDSLPREIHRAERYHHELSLIMLDLDYFKSFNDTYGHQFGDQILKQVSQQIAALIRKSDLAFRYGGEEFLLVLPETTLAEAQEKAQAIRTAVRDLVLDWQSKKLDGITLSGGVSSYPALAQSSQELISQADQALYQAKENGRDQIQVFKPSETNNNQ
jgi:diguanylate cyclase (GGDEF)-like protein